MTNSKAVTDPEQASILANLSDPDNARQGEVMSEPCPRCGKPAKTCTAIDDDPQGTAKTTHHACPCGWDDFPPETDATRQTIADFLAQRTPNHKAPPENGT